MKPRTKFKFGDKTIKEQVLETDDGKMIEFYLPNRLSKVINIIEKLVREDDFKKYEKIFIEGCNEARADAEKELIEEIEKIRKEAIGRAVKEVNTYNESAEAYAYRIIDGELENLKKKNFNDDDV